MLLRADLLWMLFLKLCWHRAFVQWHGEVVYGRDLGWKNSGIKKKLLRIYFFFLQASLSLEIMV